MAGTPCETGTPQWLVIGCHSDDLLVHCANRAQVERLVTRGTGAPGGDTFIDVLNPVLSDNGDVVFVGVVATDWGSSRACSSCTTVWWRRWPREGDAMPGGGAFLATGFVVGNADINDRGEIAFSATLDSDDDGDGPS